MFLISTPGYQVSHEQMVARKWSLPQNIIIKDLIKGKDLVNNLGR